MFVIALIRLLCRLKEGPISSVSVLPKWQSMIATVIHYFLLLATLAIPISGLMMNIGGGRDTSVTGIQLLAAGEKIEWLASAGHFVHGQAVNIIIVALSLHILGALKHQDMDRDGTLSRMLGR